MKHTIQTACAALGASVLLLSATSLAQTFTWNFSVPNNSVASPHVYFDTTAAVKITAYGYDTATGAPVTTALGKTWGPGATYDVPTGTITSKPLYGKHDGLNETGLGLDKLLGDHEIDNTSFVQLDVTDMYAKGIKNFTMGIGSIQKTEGYMVWGSNSQGVPGTLLRSYVGTVDAPNYFAVPDFGKYNYFSISGTPIAKNSSSSDVVILDGASTAVIPEPTTYAALAGTALLGFAFARRAKK
jgi:hypothetical protein